MRKKSHSRSSSVSPIVKWNWVLRLLTFCSGAIVSVVVNMIPTPLFVPCPPKRAEQTGLFETFTPRAAMLLPKRCPGDKSSESPKNLIQPTTFTVTLSPSEKQDSVSTSSNEEHAQVGKECADYLDDDDGESITEESQDKGKAFEAFCEDLDSIRDRFYLDVDQDPSQQLKGALMKLLQAVSGISRPDRRRAFYRYLRCEVPGYFLMTDSETMKALERLNPRHITPHERAALRWLGTYSVNPTNFNFMVFAKPRLELLKNFWARKFECILFCSRVQSVRAIQRAATPAWDSKSSLPEEIYMPFYEYTIYEAKQLENYALKSGSDYRHHDFSLLEGHRLIFRKTSFNTSSLQAHYWDGFTKEPIPASIISKDDYEAWERKQYPNMRMTLLRHPNNALEIEIMESIRQHYGMNGFAIQLEWPRSTEMLHIFVRAVGTRACTSRGLGKDTSRSGTSHRDS